MNTLTKLDWLTIVVPSGVQSKKMGNTFEWWVSHLQKFSLATGGTAALVEVSSRRFEITACEDKKTGVRWAVTYTKEGANIVAQYSGSVLFSRAAASEFLKCWNFSYPDARITRFDVAIDVKDEYGKLHAAVMEEVASGARENPVWNTRLIAGKCGNSVYLGSRLSSAMVRIYQKKLNADAPLMCRFEIEGKPENVLKVSDFPIEILLSSGISKLAKMLEKYCPKSSSEVRNSLPSDAAAIRWYKHREEGNRERWFLETVLPAFQKLMDEDTEGAARICGLIQATLYDKVEMYHDIANILKIEGHEREGLPKQYELW